MDLQYFFNILWRRKWLILTVMLVAAAATYYFVDKKIDTYKADAVITTRIVGERGVNPREEKPWIMEFYVKMGFENMIEAITSRRNINFLTSRLLLHDLRADTLSGKNMPFRRLAEMDDVELDYSPEVIEDLLDTLQYKVDNLVYAFSDPFQEKVFTDLAIAFSYDYKNILKYNLNVARSGDTDNLMIEFESEDPQLSVFAVNTFCKDYVRIYQDNKQADGDSSVDFLKKEADEKYDKLLALENRQNSYRSNTSLYNAADESQAILSRRNDINSDLELERSRIPALQKNIAQLETMIASKSGQYKGAERAKRQTNTAVINMQNEIARLNEIIIKSNNTDLDAIKRKELIQLNLDAKIEKIAELAQGEEDQLSSKTSEENLFDKQVSARLELNDAEQRVITLQRELESINEKQNRLVTNDAVVQKLESEIKIARKDYELLQYRLGEAKLNVNDTYQPLKILERARIPEEAEPKKKILLSTFAGVVGGILSTVFIFLMAFFDTSVNSASKFRKFTQVDLLGTVNKVKTDNLDLKFLFSSNGQNKKLDTFKESLRNIRYSIENTSATRFLFTSTKKQEGKTFLIVTLAHALTIKDKKILIVDTNFKNNTLTQMSKQTIEENLLNSKLIGESDLDQEFVSQQIDDPFNLENVDIIGNKGSYQSPSEVFAGKDFDKFLDGIEKNYDYIFFEGAPLNMYSDTKELVQYVDKIIAVFGAENEIKAADKDSIAYLKSLGDKFMGAILNKMELRNLN